MPLCPIVIVVGRRCKVDIGRAKWNKFGWNIPSRAREAVRNRPGGRL